MKKLANQGNRGMHLERMIETSNVTYRNKGLALVTKRPTPVIIERKMNGGKIAGRLEKASTVDFDGVYKGRSLQFEAKQIAEKTRFPLDKIQEHQVQHLRQALKHGAIAFVIIEFTKQRKTFYLPAARLIKAWDDRFVSKRKSIPYEEFEMFCSEITSGRGVPLDYLAAVDREMEEMGETA